MIKFEQWMYEAQISSHREQKFSIKIEIDTNPTKGANLRSNIVNKYFLVSFLSYDIHSLLAGKLHALLSRKYTKGRDCFDLVWYLSRWKNIILNISLLQNVLTQTGWKREMPTADTWRDFLYGTVRALDWHDVENDVKNFLENPSDTDIFRKSNLLNLIKGENGMLLPAFTPILL